MGNYIFVYKSNGIYLGFIWNSFLYSRDGEYLGWIDGSVVWDNLGRYRGEIYNNQNHVFLILNQLIITPLPRGPKFPPLKPSLPDPPPNIPPINLPLGYADAF